MVGRRGYWLLAAGVSFLASTTAWAQQDAGAASASDANSNDIIVTATKRGERLQDVPAAITALDGDDLLKRGLTNMEAIATQVPGVNFGQHAGATQIAIRGVGSVVDSGLTEPSVAIYVDGIYLPRSTMGALRGVDLERVEVLRGPQGTLYGRNATGGAINFISRAPTKAFEGEVTASTGSRNAFGIEGYMSGPLASGVSVRLSGGHQEADGYVKVINTGQRLVNVNDDYVRFAVRLEPTDTLRADLAVRYESNTGANAFQQLYTPAGAFIPPTALQTTARNKIYSDGPFRMDVKTLIASGVLNWQVSDGVTMKSVTGYVDHKSAIDFDADGTDYPFYNAFDFKRPSKSFSQEFDLIGDTGRLKWILGAYYFHEKYFFGLPVVFIAGLNTGDPASSIPPGAIVHAGLLNDRTESFALFGDATYSLTDRLRLNVGLRFNTEKKRFESGAGVTLPGIGFVGVTGVKTRFQADKLLPKVALQFDVNDDINGYVQWQKGYKSGGQNLQLLPEYLPESINAYEVGLKTQWLDRRLTANFAAFYYDYKDLQVTIVRPPAITLVQNADVTVYGLEGEINFQVTNAFRLNASATALHARNKRFFSLDDANPGAGVQDLKGKPISRAPDFTFNAGAEYRFDLGGNLLSTLTIRADVSYSSKVVLRYFILPEDVQKRYALLNLSAVLADVGEKTALRAFVNNVTNKLYRQSSGFLAPVGAWIGNYSAPRTWGLQLSRKF